MSLRIRLRHRLGDLALATDIDAPAGITVLFGRSGAGKSSVIRAVAGLIRPDEGRVAVDGAVLTDTAAGVFVPLHRRGLGAIFQDGRLWPHLTVRGNLTYSARVAGRRPAIGLDEVADLLDIAPLMARRPGGLSGGERARVAIGRALLSAPRLILADEPLASLDAERRAEILPYFERLRDAMAVPMLYVTHDAAEVARLATWIVTIEAGAMTAQGLAAEILSDARLTPAGIRAAGALIEARVAHHHADGLTELDAGGVPILVPRLDLAPGAATRLRLAAHEVLLARKRPEALSALNVLPGEVTAIRTGAGPGALVSVATAAGPILARITARSVAALDLAPGIPVFAVVKSVSIAPNDAGRPARYGVLTDAKDTAD